MGLTDMLSVAVQHPEKDALAWMMLHSLYHARIVSHANTGKACVGKHQEQKGLLPSFLSCNCFLNLKTGLVLLDTGEAWLLQMSSTLDGNEQLHLTTSTDWRWEQILLRILSCFWPSRIQVYQVDSACISFSNRQDSQ